MPALTVRTGHPRGYFLDVGQGSANVILLAAGEAIVIDTGRSGSTTLPLLRQLGIDRIASLVLTHNDQDHAGAMSTIIKAYWPHIGYIHYPQDRPVREIGWWTETWRALGPRFDEFCEKCRRLETNDHRWFIWRNKLVDRRQAQLVLLYPSFPDNQRAQSARDTNATSGVLLFEVGESALLFTGDAPLAAWQRIHERWGRVTCDVMSAPHHAGRFEGAASGTDEVHALDWLFSTAVCCRVAVTASVGSRNTHGHPRPAFVRSVTTAGLALMCTEITSQCHAQLDRLGPGVLPAGTYSTLPSLTSLAQATSAGRSTTPIGCAGTIEATLGPSEVNVRPMNLHREAVDAMAQQRDGRPLCRPRR